MLRVTIPQKQRAFPWIPISVLSLLVHLVLLISAGGLAAGRRHEPYQASRFDVALNASEPEPPTAHDKPPEPEPETRKIARKPRPNTAQERPEPEIEQPPEPVFGVTAESLAAGSNGPAIRVGNTLEKPMEKRYTPPQKVAPLAPAQKAPPRAVPLHPVPVYKLTTAPAFERKVEPVYPEQARRAGIEGTVQLEIWLDETGRVRKIRVLKSPGHGLDRAAITAAARTRFSPGKIDGKPVPVKITVPYQFVLDA